MLQSYLNLNQLSVDLDHIIAWSMTICHDMRNFFLVIFFLVLSDKLQILKLARNRDKLCQTPNNENQIFSPLVQVRLHETSLKIVIWNSLFHKSNISYFFTNWKFHIFLLLILYSISFFRNQTFHMLSRIYSCCISPQYWQLGQSTKLPLVIIFLQLGIQLALQKEKSENYFRSNILWRRDWREGGIRTTSKVAHSHKLFLPAHSY